MKKLYFFKAASTCSTIFVDQRGAIVRDLHENDGDFNQEYMGFIAVFFGGKTIEITLNGPIVDDEGADDFVESNQSTILAAIAAANA